MLHEQVSIRVPGILKYNHFISDAGELLFRERITCYADELLQQFLQDMRIILYELFANAYYHSKSDFINVDFELDEEWITIHFKTYNIGYGVKSFTSAGQSNPVFYPPYPDEMIGKEYVIYEDFASQVLCTVKGPYQTVFSNKRVGRGSMTFDDLPEHYGMNLITKFSHETTYNRDENGVDCFTIRRRIR